MLEKFWPNINQVLLVSVFVFIIGLWSFLDRSNVNLPPSPGLAPNNIERQLAINTARVKGETTYSYTTNFIPGIGTIADPKQYKDNLFDQLKNLQLTK